MFKVLIAYVLDVVPALLSLVTLYVIHQRFGLPTGDTLAFATVIAAFEARDWRGCPAD